jgi:hypothetical protein
MGMHELLVGNQRVGPYVRAPGRHWERSMTARDRMHPPVSWRKQLLARLGLGDVVILRTFPIIVAASGDQIRYRQWVQREESKMSAENNHARAVRYRKLALSELDKDKAGLLNRIADEAEQGVLCTADNIGSSPTVKLSVG